VLPVPALAPLEPPWAPEVDEPPVEPDEPVTDELPNAPVPDDELPMLPDEVVLAPVLDEPDGDEPPVEPEVDDPLLPAPLEPILPVAPVFVLPATLEPVDGLALDDEPPDMLPDEPALADEPLVPLFRLLD